MKRIKKFSIANLFGYKSVSFDFSENDTIIFTGLNGAGKSHVLRLLHGCLTANEQSLAKIEFEGAEVKFDDGSIIFAWNSPITKYRKNRSHEENHVFFYAAECTAYSGQEMNFTRIFPRGGESRMSPSTAVVTGSGLNGIRIFHYYPVPVRGQFGAPTEVDKPNSHKYSILIDTDRLFMHQKSDARAGSSDASRRSAQLDIAEIYLGLLQFSYERLDEEVASRQAKLQSNLSNQMIDRMSEPEPSQSVLREKYQRNVGLVNYCKDYKILLEENVDNAESIIETEREGQSALRKVFDLIYDNQSEVIAVAMPFAERIELLFRVLNSSFQDSKKEISIEVPGDNLRLRRRLINPHISFTNGYPINVKNLSSGEKHLLAIYITVAVSSYPGSAVFIDEPEISLHPRWQMDFLDNLRKFSELIGFQLFIATHSPTIVGDNWQFEREVPMIIPPLPEGSENVDTVKFVAADEVELE